MKTGTVNSRIFVFGNPLRTVEKEVEEYGVSVVGTMRPDSLINGLETSNDADLFFFIVGEEDELDAVNDMFEKLKKPEDAPMNFFVLIKKSLASAFRTYGNSVYLATYDEVITESLLRDMVIEPTLSNQIQYYTKKEERPKTMTGETISKISNMIGNYNKTNTLTNIKEQFKQIRDEQDDVTITKMLEDVDIKDGGLKLETQNFLYDREEELKEQLKRDDLTELEKKEITETILELYYLISSDLQEASKKFFMQNMEAKSKDFEKTEEESKAIIESIEQAIINGEEEELEILLEQRNNAVTKLRIKETEVIRHSELMHEGLTNHFIRLKETSTKMLTSEFGENLPVAERKAFQVQFNKSKDEMLENSQLMLTQASSIIEGYEGVRKGYSKIVDLDTNIIDRQQVLVDTLKTQKVSENVEYSGMVSSKLHLVVSPTANLGCSTLMSIAREKYGRVVVLDFRNTTSTTRGYSEISLDEFLNGDFNTFEDAIKVKDPLASNIDLTELESRLDIVLECYDKCFILVDMNLTIGVDFETIQRVVYLSDTSDDNLLKVNEAIQIYEMMFTNLNRKTLVMNKVTAGVRDKITSKLTHAGVDASKTKVTIVPFMLELMDNPDDERQYKLLSQDFEL